MLEGKKVLILGGTAFIGRAFCQAMVDRTSAKPTLLNRGRTNQSLFPKLPRIVCDRDNRDACSTALRAGAANGTARMDVPSSTAAGAVLDTLTLTMRGVGRHRENDVSEFAKTRWDTIVDFSGQNHVQIQHIVSNCEFDHYTFLSSSAVDLAMPGDPFFSLAQNKLWCEHLVAKQSKNVLIVRSGFVVGPYDYTNRFQKDEVTWHWRGTQNPVRPVVEVELLVNMMLQLIDLGHTGIVRAGYGVS